MASVDFGFNRLTLAGDRTNITYFTETPALGPVPIGHQGGRLDYQGVDGDLTFFGPDIRLLDTPLGTLLTVTLRRKGDIGGIDLHVLVPSVFGVTRQNTVTFQTLAILSTSRGFVTGPGVQLTYTIVPLLATAEEVILPR